MLPGQIFPGFVHGSQTVNNAPVPVPIVSNYSGQPPAMPTGQIVSGFSSGRNTAGITPAGSKQTQNNALESWSSSQPGSNSDVVLTGVDKQVTTDMITSHAALRGIHVLSCELMTKWERARSHTYKLTVKEQHADIALSDSVWPLGVTARRVEQRTNSRNRMQQNAESAGNRHVSWHPSVSTRFYS